MVDIAVATASRSPERATTDIDSCWRHKYAADENKSARELIAMSSRAFFSHVFKFFFIGIADLPLLDKSNKETSASRVGTLSVRRY